MSLNGSTGAGVRLLGGAGVPNGVLCPVAVSPCGLVEKGARLPGFMTGPVFPWASEYKPTSSPSCVIVPVVPSLRCTTLTAAVAMPEAPVINRSVARNMGTKRVIQVFRGA